MKKINFHAKRKKNRNHGKATDRSYELNETKVFDVRVGKL